MSDIPPPEAPGWYADANGAWWWWDGGTWTPAPGARPAGGSPSPRDQERTHALLSWILYIVLGGWIAALVFYLISKDKLFVRHHAAEALNLTLVLLVPQILGIVLLVPDYVGYIREAIDDPDASFSFSGLFFVGMAVVTVSSIANLALGITAAIKAHRGEWWRLPIGIHPVRGVLRKGEAPPYSVTEG